MNIRDCWETPKELFDELDKEFNFDVDLCATDVNSRCKYHMDDYLTDDITMKLQDFTGVKPCKSAFMNPPYSNPRPFIEKAWEDSRDHKIVCLLKVDPSTRWWAVFWDYNNHRPKAGCKVRFLPKRVKFVPPEGVDGSSGPAFASCIVIMDRR